MRIAFATIAVLILVLAIFHFWRPAAFATKVKYASGVVSSIYVNSSKQATIKIQGFKTAFTIPGDLLKKLDLNILKQKLMGKQVKVLYADRWTPLDPGCTKEAAEITVGQDVLFSDQEK